MNELKRTSMIRRAMAAGQGRIVLAAALVTALFAGVGVFHASTHVAVVRAGYDLDKVQNQVKVLKSENEHLKLERATLRSAPRLESIARARLGLQAPMAGQIVAIKARKLSVVEREPQTKLASAANPAPAKNP
ncbi:MAG: cell division protein FtsL [Myxococcales bacterium]